MVFSLDSADVDISQFLVHMQPQLSTMDPPVPVGNLSVPCGEPSQCGLGLGLLMFCSWTVLCHHWEH